MAYSAHIRDTTEDAEGDGTMDSKHVKRPNEGLVEPEEHGTFIDSGDVEGHGLPLTPPPSFGSDRGPSHGGEIAMPADPDDDDVEGHHRK